MRHLSRINHIKEKKTQKAAAKEKKTVFKLQGFHIAL